MANEPLPLFVHWEGVVNDLLSRTEKFPKSVRFTFSTRIDNLALDIYEALVDARYTRQRTPILKEINGKLEKLRLLLRLCHTRAYLSHKGYEHINRNIDEAGRMLGGWLKQQESP